MPKSLLQNQVIPLWAALLANRNNAIGWGIWFQQDGVFADYELNFREFKSIVPREMDLQKRLYWMACMTTFTAKRFPLVGIFERQSL